jgi:hypothetical protein
VRFSAPFQTDLEAQNASYTMGNESFPGVNWPGRGVHHPLTSSAEVKERVEIYIYSPSGPSWPVLWRTLYNYALQPLRLIVRSWLDVPTFATRRLHACHHTTAPSGGRWNCGREMSCNFVQMRTCTPFREFLHALKLRQGTDGFTSPAKEGVLRIYSP